MTTPRILIGIDPGHDNAAAVALLDTGDPVLQVLAVSSYRRTQRDRVRGWTVETWTAQDQVAVPGVWCSAAEQAAAVLVVCVRYVGRMHPETPVAAVTVEGVRWGGGKGRRRTAASIATLATSRGRILQALHAAGYPVTSEPVAADWRPRVLRVSGSSSGAAAKQAAIAWVTGRRVIRRNVPDWRVDWPDGVACQDHAAEATCLAVWGRGA